jgi:hypothetical protein
MLNRGSWKKMGGEPSCLTPRDLGRMPFEIQRVADVFPKEAIDAVHRPACCTSSIDRATIY